MRRNSQVLVVYGVLSAILAGCGRSPTISGQVTYAGKPVKNGAISFLPADGHGPSCGGKIVAGQYRVEIPAGKKIVQIISSKSADRAITREELERETQPPPTSSADDIPDNAEGNNSTVEIQSGHQTLDFHLQPPTTVKKP